MRSDQASARQSRTTGVPRAGLLGCGLASVLALGLALGGCAQDAEDTGRGGGAAGAGPDPGPESAVPLISKPPDWYVSYTDRFQRLFVVDGQAAVSPGGRILLVTQTAVATPATLPGGAAPANPPDGAAGSGLEGDPEGAGPVAAAPPPRSHYRLLQVSDGGRLLEVDSATLCELAGVPAGTRLEVRANDDGWLYFRSDTGFWLRYFPSTGKAKPAFDGFQVVLLSRNLYYAVGVKNGAPSERLLLDFSAVGDGGPIGITPLAAEVAEAVRVVGDTGVLQLKDGRFCARDGHLVAALRDSARWEGGFVRCVQTGDGLAVASLEDPPVLAPLPVRTQAWWILTNRLVAFDGVTVWAADPRIHTASGFRSLPLPLRAAAEAAEADGTAKPTGLAASGNAPAAPAVGSAGPRSIVSIAVVSGDIVVLQETGARDEVRSAVYRWSLLR